MAIRPWGNGKRELAAILEGVEFVPIPEDPLELEHVEFVRHHPAFPEALERFREDVEHGVGTPWTTYRIDPAIADPESSENFLTRRFAAEWGLTAAVAYYLALNDRLPDRSSVETYKLAVRATPLEYVVRIPRPLTPERRRAVENWLKSEKEPGASERAWGKAGKKRFDQSPRAVAAIPWFERWNAGEEPAAIYRDVAKEEQLDFESFHSSLVSCWERMKSISPDEVRTDRPSKASA